jgi:hypothetical protein
MGFALGYAIGNASADAQCKHAKDADLKRQNDSLATIFLDDARRNSSGADFKKAASSIEESLPKMKLEFPAFEESRQALAARLSNLSLDDFAQVTGQMQADHPQTSKMIHPSLSVERFDDKLRINTGRDTNWNVSYNPVELPIVHWNSKIIGQQIHEAACSTPPSDNTDNMVKAATMLSTLQPRQAAAIIRGGYLTCTEGK